jgi:glycosyltransferase involved in cell wall biosynthesis
MSVLGRQLTAVILTLNEAEHLPDCLRSLQPLTDSVLVLDSGSTDRTRAIAEAAGARVEVRAFDGYASQRNAALALVTDADWVFFLDADERLTTAGARELHEVIATAPCILAGLWVPRRNICFGRELRGGGWWPDYQARGFRPGRAWFDERRQVHEVATISGESYWLREPLVHQNYRHRWEFIAKQRLYTVQRVRSARGGNRPRRRAYVSAPARELYRRLVRLHGYRDGLDGVFMASVLALEEVRACRLLRAGVQR